MIRPIMFKNRNFLTLRGYIHEPTSFKKAVVFLHGFPANNNYLVSARIGDSLEEAGFLVLRFEFSCTDSSDGELENKLISEEVNDIKYAVDYIYSNYCINSIVLIGHSTGAADAALYSYQDNRISKLILLGGIGNLQDAVKYDFNDEQVESFLNQGFIIFDKKGYWIHNKHLKRDFYDEFFTLDVLGSLKKFKNSVLIIHGSNDNIVPVWKDPVDLYRAAQNSRLVIIKDADHIFLEQNHWNEVVSNMVKFINSEQDKVWMKLL